MAEISIGELARRSGVKVPTIRYYEGVGLLRVPARTGGLQRRYDAAAVARLLSVPSVCRGCASHVRLVCRVACPDSCPAVRSSAYVDTVKHAFDTL